MKHKIQWGLALLMAAAACLFLLALSVMAQEEAPLDTQEETLLLDASGSDAVVATPTPTPEQEASGSDAITKPAKGDINGDGSVNLKDVTVLFQYVNRQIDALDNLDGADINGDDAVNLKDVTVLFQYVNRQIDAL